MLTPNYLRKISVDAIERKEKERLDALNRAKREQEEALRLEQLKLKKLKEEKRRLRILNLTIGRTAIEMVKASVQGSPQYYANPVISIREGFAGFYLSKGYFVKTYKGKNFVEILKNDLKNLRQRLRISSVLSEGLLRSFMDDLFSFEEKIDSMIDDAISLSQELMVIRDRIDQEFSSRGESFGIEEFDLIITRLESKASGVAGDGVDKVLIKWVAKDLTDFNVCDIHDLPFWLVSTSGYGLISTISSALRMEAESGSRELVFECYALSKNPVRWGDNFVFKVVCKSVPLGIIPCSPVFLERIVKIFGFEVELKDLNSCQSILVKW